MASDQGEIQARLAGIAPIVVGVIRSYLEPLLAEETLVEGVTPTEAADHLARLIGSLIVDEGSWDLGDPVQVRELVDRWLLAGIVVIDIDIVTAGSVARAGAATTATRTPWR